LLMAVDEIRALAERRRGAEEKPLLAAEQAAFVLRQRRDLLIAHPRPDRRRDLGEDFVLHLGRAADQCDLLRALDRLETVDEIRRIDEFGGEALLDPPDEAMRHRARADQTDAAIVAAPEIIERELGLITVGVGNR